MCTTPAANSAKAAPRRHSPPDVFPAVRRRASRPCSRMQSVPTAPSLRRSHFGRNSEGELAAAVSRRWRPSFHREHPNHRLWHVTLALTRVCRLSDCYCLILFGWRATATNAALTPYWPVGLPCRGRGVAAVVGKTRLRDSRAASNGGGRRAVGGVPAA